MAKVTNTSNVTLYIGKTEIKPHSTVEVPDDQLAQAKANKVVASWFASEKLALGDTAAKKEEECKDKPHTEGTPAGTIRPAITTGNVLRGAARGIVNKFR
jgi:hypothetical protein